MNVFLQKEITLNREEIIHNLNYGKILSLCPTKMFCDFPLGEIIKPCATGHTKLFGDNGDGTPWETAFHGLETSCF